MLLTDSASSVAAVGSRDLSPAAILRRNGLTTPVGTVFPGVHTPYDYDQRI
jgi:hypothetical protein